MSYEFRTASGRICCRNDGMFDALCPSCQARARAQGYGPAPRQAAGPVGRTSTATDDDVAPPPPKVDQIIRAGRADTRTREQRMAAAFRAVPLEE